MTAAGLTAPARFFMAGAALFLAVALIAGCAAVNDNNSKLIADLVRHLEKQGLKVEGVKPMRCDTVKAEGAAAIKINGREIGVYQYDITKKKAKEKLDWIKEKGFMYVYGVKYKTLVNGSFVLTDYEENPQKDALIKAFESF